MPVGFQPLGEAALEHELELPQQLGSDLAIQSIGAAVVFLGVVLERRMMPYPREGLHPEVLIEHV